LRVGDPLFALVVFNSLFNLLGIILFYPLVRPFARFLNRRFAGADKSTERYISKTSAAVSEAAVESLRLETRRLIDQAAALNLKAFDLSARYSFYDSRDDRTDVDVFRADSDYDRSYQSLKQFEGAILSFALRVQNEPLEDDESAQLGQVLRAIRSAVHSAKCLKDVHADMHSFRESESDFFNAYYGRFRLDLDTFYRAVNGLKNVDVDSVRFERLAELLAKNSTMHDEMHQNIYQEATLGDLNAVEISTLLNVNRELFTSNQSLILAIADATLAPDKSEDLASLKGAA
jgi:phosphate:Na+ symporter